MTERESILKQLYFYPADFISGETLSRKLGIEKSKIHTYIRELRLEGYQIDGCQNRGYRLTSGGDILNAETISKYYSFDINKIRVFSSLPSTNTTAKEMAALGAPEGTICIAESQTKGRGRMDRQFFSPDKTGLYMSIILRPTLSPADSLKITALSAVAVAETIENFTNNDAQIKWVNDVYYKNKKVCGILAESAIDPKTQKLAYVILGIGVNLYAPKSDFPKELEHIAGTIFDKPFHDGRSQFTAYLLKRFFYYYNTLDNLNYLIPYQKRSLLTGKDVTVNRFSSYDFAKVLGINDDFSLKIKLSDGTVQNLSSGEVSVKLT